MLPILICSRKAGLMVHSHNTKKNEKSLSCENFKQFEHVVKGTITNSTHLIYYHHIAPLNIFNTENGKSTYGAANNFSVKRTKVMYDIDPRARHNITPYEVLMKENCSWIYMGCFPHQPIYCVHQGVSKHHHHHQKPKAQSLSHLSWRPRSARRSPPRRSRSLRRTWWGAGCRWRWWARGQSSRRTCRAWGTSRRLRCTPPRSRTWGRRRRGGREGVEGGRVRRSVRRCAWIWCCSIVMLSNVHRCSIHKWWWGCV